MYLLNAYTLELERFDDEARILRYAILSHTWGDAEITFDNVHSLWSAHDSFGARKIRQTCRQATEDGFRYAWVDTCCIDKKSSAELSEAINSMYKWYKWADTCYVYLQDVFTLEELGAARWFTRGWTLQELIAPKEIAFYNSNWSLLGSKKSLLATLETVTGIDRDVLSNPRGLHDISIAKRMSWAARRRTTRSEDLAYSLLGIFDINMPLLYGEGEKAFVRLQEEIMKESNDQSLFAWGPNSGEFNTMPRFVDFTAGVTLARHPGAFIASSMIRPLRRIYPFAMTNNGVRINAPIFALRTVDLDAARMSAVLAGSNQTIKNGDMLVVVLDCYFTAGPSKGDRVGIVCDCIYAPNLHLLRRYGRLYPVNRDDFAAARRMDVFLMKHKEIGEQDWEDFQWS